jgi:hypothetical protein
VASHEVDHIVDRRRSRLSAFISILPDGIQRTWWLEICCKEEGVPSGVQPAHLSEVSLDFPFDDWRSFAGQQFNQAANIDDGEEPIGNLYTGMHDAVSKLRIRFGRRKGRYFRIRISGMAEGGRFLVDGVVQMESVTVRDFATDRGDVARARQLAMEIFQAADLGEPEVWQSDITFPIMVTD